MARNIGRLLATFLAAGVFLLATATESQALIGVKAGLFFPNGDSDGLEDWDNGYAAEVFLGGGGAPIGFEIGLGGYFAEHAETSDLNLGVGYLSGTLKAVLPLGGANLYGGGGVGYYVAEVDSDVAGLDSVDGEGFGYHLVAGVEAPLVLVSIFAEARWIHAQVELGDGAGDTNVGGVVASVGVRF